jgi:hypothetical protein
MGKKDKLHRKKVAKRNEQIKMDQKKLQKAKEEFIMKMIQREKEAGKFNNNPSAPTSGPIIDIEGPQI